MALPSQEPKRGKHWGKERVHAHAWLTGAEEGGLWGPDSGFDPGPWRTTLEATEILPLLPLPCSEALESWVGLAEGTAHRAVGTMNCVGRVLV